jgi:type II secretory pathway pseudopilin PulG
MVSFPRMHSKGQESAPFELLIAVILMGFVLLVGYNAIQQITAQRCASITDAQLSQMAQKLENTASGKGSSQFQFSMGECAAKVQDCTQFSANASTKDIQCIRLVDSVDPLICSNYCSSARDACTLVAFDSAKISSAKKCVDISPSTVFPSTPGSQCPDRSSDGYRLVDLKQEIKQGNYSFVKASTLTSAQPIVCAYILCSNSGCS